MLKYERGIRNRQTRVAIHSGLAGLMTLIWFVSTPFMLDDVFTFVVIVLLLMLVLHLMWLIYEFIEALYISLRQPLYEAEKPKNSRDTLVGDDGELFVPEETQKAKR